MICPWGGEFLLKQEMGRHKLEPSHSVIPTKLSLQCFRVESLSDPRISALRGDARSIATGQ